MYIQAPICVFHSSNKTVYQNNTKRQSILCGASCFPMRTCAYVYVCVCIRCIVSDYM